MSTDTLRAAAALFLEARRTGRPLAALPADARPSSEAQAYAIQDAVAAELGAVGGWKVGAAGPQAEPFCAPIQVADIADGPAVLPASRFRVIGVEAELAYRLSRPLPPRGRLYGLDEVVAAVGAVHPVIEIVDTRFAAFGSQNPLSHRADHQNNGVLIVGPAVADWRSID